MSNGVDKARRTRRGVSGYRSGRRKVAASTINLIAKSRSPAGCAPNAGAIVSARRGAARRGAARAMHPQESGDAGGRDLARRARFGILRRANVGLRGPRRGTRGKRIAAKNPVLDASRGLLAFSEERKANASDLNVGARRASRRNVQDER